MPTLKPGGRHYITDSGIRKPCRDDHRKVGYRHGTSGTGWLRMAITYPFCAIAFRRAFRFGWSHTR
jgi:hypothetical protein